MRALSKAKAGEKIFVTSAYGPVGSIVCQLAKNMGLEVIASAGSDDKVAYLRDELKVDRAFNCSFLSFQALFLLSLHASRSSRRRWLREVVQPVDMFDR
jgi:NADPH-dependent curcumin reductase CurA